MLGPWELSLRVGCPVTSSSLGEWWCPFLEIRNTEGDRSPELGQGLVNLQSLFDIPECAVIEGGDVIAEP